MGGYFHIVRKDRYTDISTLTMVDPSRLSTESLGQIKLGITTNANLKRLTSLNLEQRTIVKQNSPLKSKDERISSGQSLSNNANPFSYMSFARESFGNAI